MIASQVELIRFLDRLPEAFRQYAKVDGKSRAAFLEAIAAELERIGDELVSTAASETNFGAPKLTAELARTTGQIRMFAELVFDDGWTRPVASPGDPTRTPLPRPEMRSAYRPLGPVAVFGASNFPLAFSVPGGDTASALAAGCPVVAKIHPSHPRTGTLCAEAIMRAVASSGVPDATFGAFQEDGFELGQATVRHPSIAAVGFTGSRRGGMALRAIAQSRNVPIPFYGELSSVNPSVVLPAKLSDDPESLARGFAASITVGVGQLCTNPGLIFLIGNPDRFVTELVSKLREFPESPMLSAAIATNYHKCAHRLAQLPGVRTLVEPKPAGLFEVRSADFTAAMQDEVFGPSSLIVRCDNDEQCSRLLAGLEGQLTASIHGTAAELARYSDLLWWMERIAGRVIVNQFPTGLEVGPATVHGGPWPATTDSRFTSVGEQAILRWVRPVCYQNFPAELLPHNFLAKARES